MASLLGLLPLLPLVRFLRLHLLFLLLLRHSELIVCRVSWLLGLFLVTLLSLLSLRLLLGLLFSLLFTSPMCSSLLLVVLVQALGGCGLCGLGVAAVLFLSVVQFVSLLVLGSLLFQLGVRAFGGRPLTLRRFTTSSWSLRRRSSIVLLLMPCVLLVRQIPYRAMSLGLKVVILCWSRLPVAVGAVLPGHAVTRSWSISSLT